MQKAVSRFLKYLQVERNASDYTLKSYREDLLALAEYLAGDSSSQGDAEHDAADSFPSPAQISVLDLRGYVAALHEAGYAKTTIARRLASLRSFFRFGQREGWVDTNPAKPLRNPRRSRTLPHFLSTDDLGRLLESPPGDSPSGLRDRAILETLYAAGLRVGELVGLCDGDLDFAAGILHVRGKGKPRTSVADRQLCGPRDHQMVGRPSLASTRTAGPVCTGFRKPFRTTDHDPQHRPDARKISSPDRS